HPRGVATGRRPATLGECTKDAFPRRKVPFAMTAPSESLVRPDATEQLRELLGQRIMVIDGAMGTMIQRHSPSEADYRGARFAEWPQDIKGNSDVLVLSQPDMIRGIHEEYLAAGADIVETNTFSATTIAQADFGMQELARELNYEG